MKKLLACFLCLLMASSLVACGSGGNGNDTPQGSEPQQSGQNQNIPEKDDTPSVPQKEEIPQQEELEESGDLGDYHVEIQDFKLVQDYAGEPAIVIAYTFTNNGEENAAAMWSLSDIAYQNGVQLDSAIIADSSVLDSESSMKELQTGASIDVQKAYLLTSDTAPVEFEVSELISFDDTKLGKTFEISAGGVTKLSAAPSGDIEKELGDYTVSIISYKLSKDYEGSPAVIVNFGFTNNSDNSANFMTAINCNAFQDGVELSSAIISGDDAGSGASQMRNVKPGAGVEVSVAYVLSSETSPVSLEIEELFSFSSEKLEATIDLDSVPLA